MRAIRLVILGALAFGAVGCSSDMPVVGGLGGGGCGNARATQGLSAQSWATFENDGVRISVRRDPVRTLTVIVTSSDGRYQDTPVDPTTELADGLELTTVMGFDQVWDHYQDGFVQQPGQVRPQLKVGSCWTYVGGPADLF